MRPLPLLGKKDEKIVSRVRAGVGERSRTDSQPSNVWSQGAERRLSAGSRPQAGLHRDQEEAQVQGHQEALLPPCRKLLRWWTLASAETDFETRPVTEYL